MDRPGEGEYYLLSNAVCVDDGVDFSRRQKEKTVELWGKQDFFELRQLQTKC
jgi:hypothetical protein